MEMEETPIDTIMLIDCLSAQIGPPLARFVD